MPESTRMPRLLVRAKNGVSDERELSKDEFTIGRKADNDLVLEDSTVSGHHARISKVQAAYFIEDLRSTNGTQINGQSITRRQLQDADVIAIGHFRLVYRGDLATTPTQPVAGLASLDQTMAFTGRMLPESVKGPQPSATLYVVSGGATEDRYELTKQVTVIGAKEDATIRLSGWFAPKVVAIIARRGPAYILTPSGSGKKIRINDEAVKTPQQLEDGDRIEVGNLTLRFVFKSQQRAA